ncbi:P3 protein [Halotydeus destructor]|nr:P3 protein [Halotydeus destructor]
MLSRDPGEIDAFRVDAIRLGITKFNWSLVSDSMGIVEIGQYEVTVIQEPSKAQFIFTITISILISLNNVNMGCLLDLDTIRKVMRRPIAPVIGFCCQFLFMPLASYGIGYYFFPENIAWRLGLFTLGCSPGGTGSNFWTLLFKGDVDLSVTMTFISTLASLGMMPLWMFTLGKHLLEQGNVQVPYTNLMMSLIFLTIPLIVGLLLQKYKPTLAARLKSLLRPFTFVVITIAVSGSIYVSFYVFALMTLPVIGAGLSVAMGGYLFGAIAAAIFGLKAPQIVAVSIETALQNPGVAFVLLQLSLGQPESDLAAVPVIAQLFMTGIPMWIACAIFHLVRKLISLNGKEAKEVKLKPVQKAVINLTENPLHSDEVA